MAYEVLKHLMAPQQRACLVQQRSEPLSTLTFFALWEDS